MPEHEHESGKAFVVDGDGNVAGATFRNFSARGKAETSMSDSEIYGFLIVFNSFEEVLNSSGKLKPNEKKLIEGIANEVSVAYVDGWKVIYYTSFKKYVKYREDKLPREFTTSDDDAYHNKATKKDMVKFIHSYLPYLQVVRFAGIVSRQELEELGGMIKEDDLKLEMDSPYLIVVD